MARAIGPVTAAHDVVPFPRRRNGNTRRRKHRGTEGTGIGYRVSGVGGRRSEVRSEVRVRLAEMARAIGPVTAAHNPAHTHVSALSRGATPSIAWGESPRTGHPQSLLRPVAARPPSEPLVGGRAVSQNGETTGPLNDAQGVGAEGLERVARLRKPATAMADATQGPFPDGSLEWAVQNSNL
jgi:hypothetical protein